MTEFGKTSGVGGSAEQAGACREYLLDGSIIATTYAPVVKDYFMPHAVMLLGGAPTMYELYRYVVTYPIAVHATVLGSWSCVKYDDGDQVAWVLKSEGAEGEVRLGDYLSQVHEGKYFDGYNDYFGSVAARDALAPVAELKLPVGYQGLTFLEASKLVGVSTEAALDEEKGYCYLKAFSSKYHTLFSRVLGSDVSFEYFLALWSGCRLNGMISSVPMSVRGNSTGAHVGMAGLSCASEAAEECTVVPEFGAVGHGDRPCHIAGGALDACGACTGKLRWNRGQYKCCGDEYIVAEEEDLVKRREQLDAAGMWVVRLANTTAKKERVLKLKKNTIYVVEPCLDDEGYVSLNMSGDFIEIVIPPEVKWETCDGISACVDAWTTVMCPRSVYLRFPVEKEHGQKIMVRNRDYVGWIRWHHKYARCDPSDSCSRFSDVHSDSGAAVYNGPVVETTCRVTTTVLSPTFEKTSGFACLFTPSGVGDVSGVISHVDHYFVEDGDEGGPISYAGIGVGRKWVIPYERHGLVVKPKRSVGADQSVPSVRVQGFQFTESVWFSGRCGGAEVETGSSEARVMACGDDYWLDDGGPSSDGAGGCMFGDAYF